MSRRVGIEVSLAISEAVKMANVDVIAAYPITPQTHIVEHLSEEVADGHLTAAFVPVESEHSAMSACLGSSAAGARTYTATSSQGLALMHELMYMPSVMRLPIVMTIANRALSQPISIWNDHSDIMGERDAGWIQLFAENGQEAFDLTLIAFRLAEDKAVMLPVGVNIDGFTLSHVIEPVIFPDQELVDKYLPPYKPTIKLDIANPMSMGLFSLPEAYFEVKKQADDLLMDSKKVLYTAFEEFKAVFGREYKPVECYKCEDAETILVMMGSTAETAMTAVDEMRAEGKKVGVCRLRLWRPFPEAEFRAAIKGAKKLACIDRSMTPGINGGPVFVETKALLFDDAVRPQVSGFMMGLGGRDMTREQFKYVYDRCQSMPATGQERYEMVGVLA